MNAMTSSRLGSTSPYLIGALTVVSIYSVSRISQLAFFARKRPAIIESPLKTLSSNLSQQEINALPYPPDAIPGARDVLTPFGSIRVYEWGPEDGKKVLFVHGISTPCVSLKNVADMLVERAGARVMLIDLFGRGYSSAPTAPLHDLQLYTSLIMCAITSSPLPWTGHDVTFTIVGYSLGGGVAATFASYFSSLVSHVVMLASGGLVRDDRISWKSRILYGTEGVLPERLIEWMVGRRLGKGQKANGKPAKASKVVVRTKRSRPPRESDGMVEDDGNLGGDSEAGAAPSDPPRLLLGDKYPNSTEANITTWQLDNCDGFIPAFISCIRNAPIHHQHGRFRALAEAFDSWNVEATKKKKALLILGKRDPIISEDEIVPDMEECLGKHNLTVKVFDAAHDVPIQRPREVTESIMELWKETGW